MITYTDTHTHLYLPEFDGPEGSDAVVRRAIDTGVCRLVMPCVDASSIKPMHALAARFPENISMAVGLHPTEVETGWQSVVDSMLAMRDARPQAYVAIGEIGLDLYWDKSKLDLQLQAFEYQCRAAVSRNLPVIIHCREALAEVLEVVRGVPGLQAVFHSFGGTVGDVELIRRVLDPYFGINGIVTFKNSRLYEALPAIGLDRLLLETDSPYLAPVPHRGRRNESAYLPDIASFIAGKLSLSPSEVAEATNRNADRLFHLTTKK